MKSRVCTDAEYTTKVPIINSCYVLHATRTTDITRQKAEGQQDRRHGEFNKTAK